jgi:Zn-finger nucleic acid-binding protein
MSGPYRDPPATPYRAPSRPSYPCPRCEAGLAGAEQAGVRFDRCDRCAGIFVTADTLREMVERAEVYEELRAVLPRDGNAWAERGRVYVKCPVCETLMNRRQYASGAKVVIDWCKHHGVWFDAGELTRVLDFVADGGLVRAQAREAEQQRDVVARARADVLREQFKHPHVHWRKPERGFVDWLSEILWAIR